MNEGSPRSKSESLRRKRCILTISQVPIIAKVCKSLLRRLILRENYARRKEMRELILVSMLSIDPLFPDFMDSCGLLPIRMNTFSSLVVRSFKQVSLALFNWVVSQAWCFLGNIHVPSFLRCICLCLGYSSLVQ